MRRVLLCLAFLVALASSASAATYYVATTGSDANSCVTSQTVGTPKQHLVGASGALACLTAGGDTLLVRGGTYAEEIYNGVASGTSWTSKVRIATYPGETVWLTPNAGCGIAIVLGDGQSAKYIEFDGINIDASNCSLEALKLYDLVTGSTANHIRYQNAELKGFNNPSGFAVFVMVATDNPNAIGFNEFLNLTMHRTSGLTTEHTDGFYIMTGDNIVSGNHIYDFSGWGVQLQGLNGLDVAVHGNSVHHNKIHDATTATNDPRSIGIVLNGGTNNAFYDNLIYNLGGSPGIGLEIFNGATSLIYNNTIVDATTTGILLDTGSNTATVRNNLSYSNGGNSASDNLSNAGSNSTLSNNVIDGSDPHFAGATDFHLQLTSTTAVDQGATIALVTDDFDHVARPQGAAYDIGAYEFLTSTPPPPTTEPQKYKIRFRTP